MAKAPMDKLQLSCIQIAIVLLFFTQAKSSIASYARTSNRITSCIAAERSALLSIRAGVSDPANLLSSWRSEDCCRWKGVHCSNRTGHVIRLDLQGPDCHNSDSSKQVLGGNISSSLLGLQHLRYLDLSCNRFNQIQIPEFLGSLHHLRYLDLSLSSFYGRIPPQLGNLSNLRYFSLDSTFGETYSRDITWLSRLSSLEHLDMVFVNLSAIVHWLPVVNMLPSLKVLRLPLCDLKSSPDLIRLSNLTSLETLDISGNRFNKPITPNWFWDLTRLKHLDVKATGFYGRFPDEIGNMTSMVKLDLSFNNLVGMIPSNMKNLCNLEELFLFHDNINGSITEFFQRLPSCSWNKLRTLSLPMSNLTGSLPDTPAPLSNLSCLDLGFNQLIGPVPLWIGQLTKLIELDLSSNQLIGPVPLWIGQLTKLTELYLGSNRLDGVMHEGHLSSLDMLKVLDLSDNSIAITVSPAWVPSFNLETVELRSCQLGPKFPAWLRWQTSVYALDISNTSISDMVPDWFWRAASSAYYLNIRNNKITGVLPSTMEFMRGRVMDFSSNQINGPIPKLSFNMTDLDLSRNNLVGPLPLDFGAPVLQILLLFENSISGSIPSSLCKLRSIKLLDISGNKLTGSIPHCQDNESTTNMTNMSILNLSLRNNNLSGEFPLFLQNCKQLTVLDLAHNQFSGTLPSWIGEKMPSLAFLRLRSNMFSGQVPVELMKLVKLQYLDLSYNNISGRIPESIVNCTGMIQTRDDDDNEFGSVFSYGMSIGDNEMIDYTENLPVVTKGQERIYTGEIIYMVNLDLSCNNLMGEIPEGIDTLVALKNLNLSWNAFGGKIPNKIGDLVQIESLDLSHNELIGEIPASLSALTSLSRLNLSYNDLTGKIPSGDQLQTLEDQESIYIGNLGLCGPPLSRKCAQTEPIPGTEEHHEDLRDMVTLFLAMSSGCILGLWVVFCTFLFKRKWRVNWFMLCDNLYDQVYVQVAVSWASLNRKKRVEG